MTAKETAEAAFAAFMARSDLPALRDHGVLLGYSGGADSSLLLHLLSEYCKREGVPFLALHINHGIRGAESDAEETFCQAECKALGVPFRSVRANVPAEAEALGLGLEEAARLVRYRAFYEVCHTEGYRVIMTAHHATDHAETVLLHLLRGGGGTALCGIRPIRSVADEKSGFCGYLARPLLSLSAEQIRAAALEMGLSFVEDSSNRDTEYRRNFLRAEVLPLLRQIAPHTEQAFRRMSENVSLDMAYLDEQAEQAYTAVFQNGRLSRAGFANLHPAIGYRVLIRYYRVCFPHLSYPERVHTDAVFHMLAARPTESFSLAFPSSVCLRADGAHLFFEKESIPFSHGHTVLSLGENLLGDGSRIVLAENTEKTKNVYKNAIGRSLSPAKIYGSLFVRSRMEGDSYFYGGMTHRVKKLMADAKIPASQRAYLPVVCDERGIVWIPGFGVRDDGGGDTPLCIYYLKKEEI